MVSIQRADSNNKDFKILVAQLDADLKARDGEEHAFYHQFNGIDLLNHVVVLYMDKQPVACGALKTFDSKRIEIKRMYVLPAKRGNGLATQILLQLETWAQELGYSQCILETGKRQPEAIALYKKNGYLITLNYGQYEGVANSVCFQKHIAK